MSSLIEKIHQVAAAALAEGALEPIPTTCRWIDDGGMRFVLRVVSSLGRKTLSRMSTHADPFLPYDERLFVSNIGPDHVCLLNRFSVVDHHVLIVTGTYEDQEELLAPSDFAALATCLREIGGLAFYNSGVVAGASQSHKHLQVVPLPLALDGASMPMDQVWKQAVPAGQYLTAPPWPFLHALADIRRGDFSGTAKATEHLWKTYRGLLHATSCLDARRPGARPAPYNLLLTSNHMVVVPRSRECFQSISLNALAFAGNLLVRDEEQARVLEQFGPLAVLTYVAVGRPR